MIRILFVTVGFVYSRYRPTVTDGVSRQVHFTRDFSHAPCTCDHTHIVAQGVLGAHSFHPHAIHDVMCLKVRCWSSFCLPSLYLLLLPFLLHCLLVLCPAHQLPQCRHRRGSKPLHSRTMRSIAPWRKTILSQEQWRRLAALYDPLAAGRSLDDSRQFLSPPHATKMEDLSHAVQAWENQEQRHRERTGDQLPKDMRRAILLSMCPTDLEKGLTAQQHLFPDCA